MILDEAKLTFDGFPLSGLPVNSYYRFCTTFPSLVQFIDSYGYHLFDLTILDRVKFYMELLLLALIDYPKDGKEMAQDLDVIIEEVEVWGHYV